MSTTKLISRLSKLTSEQGIKFSPMEQFELAFSIENSTVFIKKLHSSPNRDEVMEDLESILREVAQVRKNLMSVPASDTYVFFVAPNGSCFDSDWINLASELERDDRLARKQVWLPDETSSNLTDFIDRTFLSTNWGRSAGNVKELKLLTDGFTFPEGWGELLLESNLVGADLVAELIKAEKNNG